MLDSFYYERFTNDPDIMLNILVAKLAVLPDAERNQKLDEISGRNVEEVVSLLLPQSFELNAQQLESMANLLKRRLEVAKGTQQIVPSYELIRKNSPTFGSVEDDQTIHKSPPNKRVAEFVGPYSTMMNNLVNIVNLDSKPKMKPKNKN